MVVSDAFLRRAAQDRLHVRTYAPPPGGSVACTVTAEAERLLGEYTFNHTRSLPGPGAW